MNDALLALADDLYALPPGEFTAARDALVREHRADKTFAAAIKRLPKASVSAYVVNLLVRRESEQVGQILDMGESLREAAAALDGEELRTLTRQRRALTAAVTAIARTVAGEAGVKVSDAVADQVESTLTAAMLNADAAAAVRSGLLTGALRATGLDDLDVGAVLAIPEALGFAAPARAAAPVARPQLTIVPPPPGPDPAEVKAAHQRVREADQALRAAQRAVTRAEGQLSQRQAAVLQLEAEIEELRAELVGREAAADQADAALTLAQTGVDDAVAEVAQPPLDTEPAAAALAHLIAG